MVKPKLKFSLSIGAKNLVEHLYPAGREAKINLLLLFLGKVNKPALLVLTTSIPLDTKTLAIPNSLASWI